MLTIRNHRSYFTSMKQMIFIKSEQKQMREENYKFMFSQFLSTGRLHIGTDDGLNNNQQLIQYPHSFGGRSVAMWNSVTFQRVYDTGDDLEREAMNKYPITFNGETNNVNLSPSGEMDLRSDDYVNITKLHWFLSDLLLKHGNSPSPFFCIITKLSS